jgi:histidine triad (HIT) family protein
MQETLDCIFCHIVRDSADASRVYSDERVLAFLDIQPVNPGHVLVIPKSHASNLSELDEETGGQIFKVAMQLAMGIKRSGLRCEGINFVLADGKIAGQEIMHVHLHVIPRFKGDAFGMKFGSQYGFRPKRKDLDEIARRIKVNMLRGASFSETPV